MSVSRHITQAAASDWLARTFFPDTYARAQEYQRYVDCFGQQVVDEAVALSYESPLSLEQALERIVRRDLTTRRVACTPNHTRVTLTSEEYALRDPGALNLDEVQGSAHDQPFGG